MGGVDIQPGERDRERRKYYVARVERTNISETLLLLQQNTENQPIIIMANLPVPDPPDDATCWICLDEDTDGNPLRRSCACRGSAGYAHLECMIQYATRHFETMVQKVEKDANRPLKPYAAFDVWIKCATCKQSFQRLLAIDMLERLLLLVEDCFPNNHYFCLEAHSSLACYYRRQCDPSRPNSMPPRSVAKAVEQNKN